MAHDKPDHDVPARPAPAAALGVIAVGAGCGFTVKGKRGRYVITAAHGLPSLPPPSIVPSESGVIYRLEAGRDRTGTVAPALPAGTPGAPAGMRRLFSRCLFVSLTADIAVLGEPDDVDEALVFAALVDRVPPFAISVPADGPASIPSLGGGLAPCTVKRHGTCLSVHLPHAADAPPGSPIVAPDGSAIGIVVADGRVRSLSQSPQPILVDQLPGWLLGELAEAPGGDA